MASDKVRERVGQAMSYAPEKKIKKTIDNRCGANRFANVWKPIHLKRARGIPPRMIGFSRSIFATNPQKENSRSGVRLIRAAERWFGVRDS
jgi:hypothetical protein